MREISIKGRFNVTPEIGDLKQPMEYLVIRADGDTLRFGDFSSFGVAKNELEKLKRRVEELEKIINQSTSI